MQLVSPASFCELVDVPLTPDENRGDACAVPPCRDAHSSLGLQWSDSNSGRHWRSIKHRCSAFAPGSWHTAPITLAVSGVTECLLYANGMPGDGVEWEALDRLRVRAGPQKDQESIRGLDFSAQISGSQGRGGGWRWNSIPNGG